MGTRPSASLRGRAVSLSNRRLKLHTDQKHTRSIVQHAARVRQACPEPDEGLTPNG